MLGPTWARGDEQGPVDGRQDGEDYGYYACAGQGDLIVMIRLAILDAEED